MKKVLLSAALVAAVAVPAAFADIKLPRVSPKSSVTQTVGLTDVTITYSRPGVKGRPIWGSLVPYDQVWRTGANEATEFIVSQDVKINGQALPAGTYSLHTIPGKTSWTVIFNKRGEQWGSYEYDKSLDALRIQVDPKSGPNQEWLTFSFSPEASGEATTVELAWEKIRVPFRIETNTKEQALANIRQGLSGDVKTWEDPYEAASYAFNANLDNKDEAMTWIDKSISMEENFWNLRLKASMLEKQGKKKDAIAVAEKAVKIGKEKKENAAEVAKTEKDLADWKKSAGA